MGCHDTLSFVTAAASYHSSTRMETIAAGLAKLPVYLVHSGSPTERTCPIEVERPLWKRIRDLGGNLHVQEVHCKHGKTFCHAYEIGTETWDWMLRQGRGSS